MVDHLIEKEEIQLKEAVDTTLLEDSSSQNGDAASPSSSSSASPAATAEEGVKIGNFTIGKLYAEGSASRIYQVTNEQLKGDLSLKLISQDLYRNEAAARRLLQSLHAVSQIASAHLATYYDCGRMKDGSIYLISEHLKGKTLKDLIASGELLDSQRFIDVFRQVAQALKSLHQQNIVHGDLKPSNIFLVESESGHDFVKLVDFGIATAFTEDERLEYLKLLSLSGCPNYMSPEQCLSFGLDGRSDIYSMGLVMHEALTGSPLVDGHSQVHALLKQLNLKPAAFNKSGTEVPESIEKIVMKCLQKNRSSRYFAIDDLELDLELAASDVSNIPGLAEPSSLVSFATEKKQQAQETKDRRKRRRKRLIIYGVLGTVAIASIGAGIDLRRDSTSLRHKTETEMAMGMALANAPFLQNQLSVSDALTVPSETPQAREINQHPKLSHALRHFKLAEDAARRAIWLYKLENLLNRDHKYKHNLSNLQTLMGEVYLKDQFNEDGSRRDRNTWLTRSNDGEFPDFTNLKLYPAFPGLQPSQKAFPDYVSANIWFDKAARTIKRNYDARDINLLWDRAYTKFQLDNKNPEVIELQRRVIEIVQQQMPSDKNTLLMCYRNIGLIYLMNGEFGKAVHELKEAKRIDEDLNKIQGPYSAEIKVEVAYAFLREGKFDVAEKLAKEYLSSLNNGPLDLSSQRTVAAYFFNQQVLAQALISQGKAEEARELMAGGYSGPAPTLLSN